MPAVFGIEPTAIRQCEPSTVRPSASVTTTPSPTRLTAGARDRDRTFMPRRRKTSSSTAAASASSPGSTRSRLETEHDLGAERVVGARELRAGHAGADDDQLLGQLVEVVDLLPGEDALAVGLRVGQHPRVRAGGDEHGVGLEPRRSPSAAGDHAARAVEPAGAARASRTPSRSSRAADVVATGPAPAR